LLAAALLHDVGKAEGRAPFWTRPVIVIAKRLWPAWLRRNTVAPERIEHAQIPSWRRALSYAWWHAEVGARMAERAGLSERSVLYIRTHHLPQGPAAELYVVDEVS
jgi:HD superfamily phosphodiesterase